MSYFSLIIMLPLLVVLIGLSVSIARNIARAWLDHRVKIALLERLEQRPGMLKSMDDLQALLDTPPQIEEDDQRVDYLLTGVFLAAIGLLCVLLGSALAGRNAVGAYIGGVVCVALGFILALVGLAVRLLSRAPRHNSPWWRRLFRR